MYGTGYVGAERDEGDGSDDVLHADGAAEVSGEIAHKSGLHADHENRRAEREPPAEESCT